MRGEVLHFSEAEKDERGAENQIIFFSGLVHKLVALVGNVEPSLGTLVQYSLMYRPHRLQLRLVCVVNL